MAQKRFMQEMTWPEVRDAIVDAIVIFPIGATEQHGPHLPLGTDSLVSLEILKRAVPQIPADLKAIITPQLSIGLSIEHLDFPGTLSFKDAGSLISTVKSICKNLVDYGAKKIVLWNGHGGNTAPLKAAAREVRKETGGFVVMTTYWSSLEENLEPGVYETELRVHADEGETSLMLFLFPELVQFDKAIKELPEKFLRSTHMKNLNGLPYPSWVTKDVSESGVIGDPTKASREKGEKIVEAAIKGFIDFIKELATM